MDPSRQGVDFKRVYLDQNKWVDFAGARLGLRHANRFSNAWKLALAGVDSGRLSFPLSAAHYMETAHRRDWRSRRDLALTMALLSRFETIAPRSELLPTEFDDALRATFGLPRVSRRTVVFGIGNRHAFGVGLESGCTFSDVIADSSVPSGMRLSGGALLEWELLVGPPPELEATMPDYDPLRHREVGEKFAAEQEEIRKRRLGGWNRGERADRVAKAEALAEYADQLYEAIRCAGLPRDALSSLDQDGVMKLVESIPLLHCLSQLRLLRQTSTQHAWEPNDLIDLGVLPTAIVHCDVVVTERQWVSLIRRAGLDRRFGTIVLSDLAELPEHVAG